MQNMSVVEVIKYNGSPDVFAWKFPNENLGTWTQLIVNESQQAVLFKGGQALDVFAAGRHTLTTANIPLLNNIINLPFGGNSPFAAEVWFVNRVHSLEIKWGTPNPIQLKDAKYGVLLPVRSFGQFGIQIEDSTKFLTKLVGTLPSFDRDTLLRFFRGLYLTTAKDSISTYLTEKGISILEINAHLSDLSEHIAERMRPTFDEYGIRLVNFFVNSVNIPDDDPAAIKLRDALAKRAEMNIIGFDYTQERSFDTLEGAATNPGSEASSMMGAGLGMGMGVPIGGMVGSQFGGMMQNINTGQPGQAGQTAQPAATAGVVSAVAAAPQGIDLRECPDCKTQVKVEQRFCSDCGIDLQQAFEAKATDDAPVLRACTCGFEITSDEMRFCPNCGESLEKKCDECETPYCGEPRFCSECGNELRE